MLAEASYDLLIQQITEIPLSKAETKVVRLALQGLDRQQIGAELYISHRTVDLHLYNIYQKCQVRRHTELIAKALQVSMQREQLIARQVEARS